MKENKKTILIKLIKEKDQFDYSISGKIQYLSEEEYKELKSILIDCIGSLEEMRRDYLESQV